jgi:hypothetical protein
MLTRIRAIHPPIVEDLEEEIRCYRKNHNTNNCHYVRQGIETLLFESELVVTVLATMRVPNLDINILCFSLAGRALLTKIHIGTRTRMKPGEEKEGSKCVLIPGEP